MTQGAEVEDMAPDTVGALTVQVVDELAAIYDYQQLLLNYFAYCGEAENIVAQQYASCAEGDVQFAVAKVHGFLRDWDAKLKGQPFLMGSAFSAADCCMLDLPLSLYHIVCLPVPTWYPHLWKWFLRCAEMKCFQLRGAADVGLGYLEAAKILGRKMAYVWPVKRNFGSRHLSNASSKWFALCNPAPAPSPDAAKLAFGPSPFMRTC